jgi:hypothetical protein
MVLPDKLAEATVEFEFDKRILPLALLTLTLAVNGGLNAQKPEADIWRIMPPYFDQEKGGDLAPF